MPANTIAKLYIKTASVASITENGRSASIAEGVNFVRYDDGKAVYELKSGTYEFIT